MGTHSLETTDPEGSTSQDTERNNRTRSTHSLETRGRHKSRHEKKATGQGALTVWDREGRDKSGHGKEAAEQGVLTNWTSWKKGQVRTQKEGD